MKLLLLSTGGGGGQILRSIKTLFRQDLASVQKTDARYAERLRRAVTARFLDTNAFSLADVPADERVLIGAANTRRLGSRHNPAVAREALEESKKEIGSLLDDYPAVVLIGTGGKGTGAGTMLPLAQMARERRKLVIPIFVRPSFEWHEVDKRRYDHALQVLDQFDAAQIRCVEILNDRGYLLDRPQPQAVVWERMNRPIARALRGLLYVLSDLSQVDPSDLSMLCAGPGRYRIGFAEIDPPPGQEPDESAVDEASRQCWENSYYNFTKPAGTSLVCIQGEWSNIVDGKIKGRLATMAARGPAESTYVPLYARAACAPRPWGVTALFAEHTGNHAPLEIDWPLDSRVSLPARFHSNANEPVAVAAAADAVPMVAAPVTVQAAPVAAAAEPEHGEPAPQLPRGFPTFWELCLGVNRRDAAALAIAGNGAASTIPVEGAELRKLLGTVWFRSVFAQLSQPWRERLLDVLVQSGPIANRVVRSGRRTAKVSELAYEELRQVPGETILPDAVRADVQLLIVAGALWGPDAIKRFAFEDQPQADQSKGLFSFVAFR
jgi:cell division GTPase FtsZ